MNNIIDEIKKVGNIVLLCHNNPDGDAIGSTIAMYYILKKLNKEVDIVIEKPPVRFSYIKGFELIKNTSNKEYDTAIILDTAKEERINDPSNIVEKVSKKIVIDHHISNSNYGDVNYVEDSPACCQVIYNIAKELNIEIDELIGIPLYTGLVTDSGNLSYPSVTTETFEMAADLSKIVNTSKISTLALNTITKEPFELKKIGMNNIEFYKDNQISLLTITEEDINKIGVDKSEVDILTNIGREIEGIKVTIFIRIYTDEIKVSLRSNDINVNEIANIFGGGGHINAAGITITDIDYEEVKQKLLEEVGKKIDEWNISSK